MYDKITRMAYILFLDESGMGDSESPYAVIAGVAFEDRAIWNFIREFHLLEEHHFGRRYIGGDLEIKGKKFLKRKTFKLAQLHSKFQIDERRILAKECLDNGNLAKSEHLAALAQAKIDFINDILFLATAFGCKIFACIINKDSEILNNKIDDLLRKDYIFLFEKFYYFLEDIKDAPIGIMVFDEIGKQNSGRLIGLLENYFKKTVKGRSMSNLIIPEPLFVHSDLTTGIQMADIIAYLISWSFRLNSMTEPARDELKELMEIASRLRYRTVREINGIENFELWSISYIK